VAFGNLIAEARLRQEREQGKETRRSGRPFRQIRLTLDNASPAVIKCCPKPDSGAHPHAPLTKH
jgi:hypothetical protein